MQHRVLICSHCGCPGAEAARRYFRSRGISFHEIDLTSNPAGWELLRDYGAVATPLIVIDGQTFFGFDKAGITRFLDAHSA